MTIHVRLESLLQFLKTHTRAFSVSLTIFMCILLGTFLIARDAQMRYQKLLSVVVFDRNGIPITIEENEKGHYAYTLTTLPHIFAELLIKKEDRFFYYHPGINPFSTFRAVYHYIRNDRAGGASTITQQLAKNILKTESKRTFGNKVLESIYALSVELYTTKEEILTMYANSVFLGNQVQGFETGSRAYFNKPLQTTTTKEQIALLATLSHPSTRNPWKDENQVYAQALTTRLQIEEAYIPPLVTESYSFQLQSAFELRSAGITCIHTCTTTLDTTLNEALRNILMLRISEERDRGARNGAIVVIDARTSELLALVGSPNPKQEREGGQINMAIEPRPIGSTIKPFIYLKGFEKGLRPYSRVDDREYKYPIATGFSLYPKNFDGSYRGEVTLHEALSNSLNVPTVKVLEYIGLNAFYRFLEESLHFKPIQPYESYQYGIALGGLEMDLLTLTHYFTLFPRGGTIAPLRTLEGIQENQPVLPPQSNITTLQTIAEPQYIELVNAIISDRFTGVEQFGLKSTLNLTIPSYAVKTGTSRDFHDSWVIGYTPRFVVGVWLGNSENEPLEQITGQAGAGTIWHDAMEYLGNTSYFSNTPFTQKYIHQIPFGITTEWGLVNDRTADHEALLLEEQLITSLHTNDTFELEDHTIIPLRARIPVVWSINGKVLTESDTTTFSPSAAGNYEIQAQDPITHRTEYIQIIIVNPQ